MPHPSTNFIKYQVLRGWPNEDVDSINILMQQCGLPEIMPAEFDLLMDSLSPPANFAPGSKSHRPTIEYLKKEEVYSMWSSKQEALDALALVELPQVRETIQILLMGHFTPKEIEPRIRMKHGKTVPAKSIAAYRHYIWNADLIGMREIKAYFWAHPLKDSYVACMWGSKNQALFRAGFNPKIDGKRALQEAHRNIAMRMEATRIMPDTKDTARTVATLAKELVGVHNALYGEGAGIEEMMKELQRFVMERNAPNVISIHKLAPKGNFSHGGQTSDGDTK